MQGKIYIPFVRTSIKQGENLRPRRESNPWPLEQWLDVLWPLI